MPVFQAVPLDAHAAPATPSLAPLRGLTPLRWNPTRNAMVGQDTLPGCARRLLFTFGMRGRASWPWDESDLLGSWPDEDEWRRVWGPLPLRLTPGSYLALRVLYVPSGVTQTGGVGFFDQASASGAVRVGVEFENAGSGASTGVVYYEADLPTADGGELPTGAAALWATLRELDIGQIMPPTAQAGPPGRADYSEGTIAHARVEIRGGARIVDAVLYEYPDTHHVQRHDDTAPASVHGAHVLGLPAAAPQTVGPQEARDSPGFSERRFGTLQLLRTGHRQTEKLGPHVLSWTPWESDEAHYEADPSGEVVPFLHTGTTAMVELLDPSASAYDPARHGWVVAASYAQLHRYSEPRQVIVGGNRALVPIRVEVRARWTGGAGYGLVRFQSSAHEWIDVTFADSGVLETRSVVGWLESQAAADQAQGVLQVFLRNTGSGDDGLELFGFAITWGWG